jgi:FdhD protein
MRVHQVSVKRTNRLQTLRATDVVAVEEPLEIRLQYWFKDAVHTSSLAITMRSPGEDSELATGLLYSEGIIRDHSEIVEIRPLGGPNEILVELSKSADVETRHLDRALMTNSACGICGARHVEALQLTSRIDSDDTFRVPSTLVYDLPALLQNNQEGFSQTGGLHAAVLVDIEDKPVARFAYEDIGRHNALDKLIGHALLNEGIPLKRQLLLLSSRSSFELVQKTARAGAPVLATIGSPSSLAIDAAKRCGLTLIGFVREDRFNVYTGEWRINFK